MILTEQSDREGQSSGDGQSSGNGQPRGERPSLIDAEQLPNNHLLRLLPEEELARLLPHLERVTLKRRELVHDANARLDFAYFPESGMLSLVGLMADGSAVEVATVGSEGMVGVPLFLGSNHVVGQAFCQVPGDSLRMRADRFQGACREGRLREIMQHYTAALLAQLSQAAACNRLHLTEERFARWLLMSHDRVGGDVIALTHDFLSQMLGVRRATVSQIAIEAQRAGIIEYSRGHVNVLNRDKLEEMSCECYCVIQEEYERLLGTPRGRRPIRRRIEPGQFVKDGMSTAGDGAPRDVNGAVAIEDAALETNR